MSWLRKLFRRGTRSRDVPGGAGAPLVGSPPPGGGSVCDVCNTHQRREDGYLLTTRQVVVSERYWVATSSSLRAVIGRLSPSPADGKRVLADSMRAMIPQMAGQRSPWAVCTECIELFAVDRDAARSYARTNTTPPGCGPVAPRECEPIVARVLNELD